MRSQQKPALHQDWIDSHAIDIVQRLEQKGHTTYLVGGCVRDLLVGIPPKDFDIATTARPEQVKRCIPQSYIIGKRFRLVLVKRGQAQYEVATFRRNVQPDEFPDGAPDGDNVFGSPEEDATRRDFTINSLFYDPVSEELIDYNSGLQDIEDRMLRMIGPAVERMIEDPIRILRALRLTHKLGFSLDPEIREAIAQTADHIPSSVLPRRREEILKILRLKNPELVFREAYDLGVLKYLSPTLQSVFDSSERREIFCHYLQRWPGLIVHPQEPAELFALLVFAYARTITEMNHEGPITLQTQRLFKEDEHCGFFRNELGMFKHEQSFVAKTLQLVQALERTEDYKRKGERRRYALLRNDSFAMALNLVEADYLLHPEDVDFWYRCFEEALPKILSERREKEQDRRRRSRRPGGRPRRSQSRST